MYRYLEDVLQKSFHGDKTFKKDLDVIFDFYKDDLDKTSLSSQLETSTSYARNYLYD